MGWNNGPQIVTNGLIMLLDAANHKSYPGSGTAWKDISGGQSNNATNYGATWNSSGYFSFDSDYMDLNNDLGYDDDVSIFALFRINSGAAPGSYHIIMGGQEMEISINYSDTITHQVVWKYIGDSNKYERWQANSRHIDYDGSIIEADNVVIQYANTKIIDNVGRKDIDLIGEGVVIVFRDGIVINGSWRKDSVSSRTVFYDENGQEIELNRGKTWIQVVPTTIGVEY